MSAYLRISGLNVIFLILILRFYKLIIVTLSVAPAILAK